MASTYELYEALTDIRVKWIKKQDSDDIIDKNVILWDVIIDGEEVMFELTSSDLWINFKFILIEKTLIT
jgi:hypothetical protein